MGYTQWDFHMRNLVSVYPTHCFVRYTLVVPCWTHLCACRQTATLSLPVKARVLFGNVRQAILDHYPEVHRPIFWGGKIGSEDSPFVYAWWLQDTATRWLQLGYWSRLSCYTLWRASGGCLLPLVGYFVLSCCGAALGTGVLEVQERGRCSASLGLLYYPPIRWRLHC